MSETSLELDTKDYQTIAFITGYWRPGENYQQRILDALKDYVRNGDIMTISEKAISTASGNIVNENPIKASALSRFLAGIWMHFAWGYILGTLSHLRGKTIRHFKTYPIEEGAKHKQLAFQKGGLLQALMHGSEAAIDGSNLPYSFVSLPLKDPSKIAHQIRHRIRTELNRDVTVMIVDTDKSYVFHNFHFSPRPKPIRGIKSHGGVFAYLLGRALRLKTMSTPIALSGSNMNPGIALQIAEIANKARGYGSGRNVWDMAEKFKVKLTEVTWEMLEGIEHRPIVIVRPQRKSKY